MPLHSGYLIACVTGCAQAVLPADKLHEEISFQINMAMKKLYHEGYRRMRVVPMTRTGDAMKYRVMGWAS